MPNHVRIIAVGWVQTTTYANAKTLIQKKDSYGRLLEKTDLGLHKTTYSYDYAGRLTEYRDITYAATGGASQAFTYYNTNTKKTVTNTGYVTTFGYDANGNLISEKMINGSVVYKDQTAQYDAMNRITVWNTVATTTLYGATINTVYDANGNIRRRAHTIPAYAQGSGQFGNQTLNVGWFKYDAMNRMTLGYGDFIGGQIVRGKSGADYLYNPGNELTQKLITKLVNRVGGPTPGSGQYSQQNYSIYLNNKTDYVYANDELR
jgi:YD repeat-containing protein